MNVGMVMPSRRDLEDTIDLTVAYIREETVGPLRGAFRWLGVGLLASVAVVIGTVMTVLGMLRLSQDLLSDLGPAWSAVPYLVAGVASVAWTAMVLSRIDRDRLS